ncbi:MAG: 16S rRNA (guanine(527)-N(7))-methyltransferase RsmG [Desulfovibrionaceae bacterium]|nr:16S rRNA (guanine(527)-N(7))-methyltransferase RsmG [Desulfovibrionaceae bacterium]
MRDQEPNREAVLDAAAGAGRPVSPGQAEGLAEFLSLLVKWNRGLNLVGPGTWRDIFDRLVVDSLFLADFLTGLDLAAEPLCLDLGAGAGLPGIPLRLVWGPGDYWLVESRQKRAAFMRSALARLGLARTTVFHGRAEDAAREIFRAEGAAGADLVLGRAFMPWPEFLAFSRPLLGPEKGLVLVMANEPPPGDPGPGWSLAGRASYPAAGASRYFWALTPESISR